MKVVGCHYLHSINVRFFFEQVPEITVGATSLIASLLQLLSIILLNQFLPQVPSSWNSLYS